MRLVTNVGGKRFEATITPAGRGTTTVHVRYGNTVVTRDAGSQLEGLDHAFAILDGLYTLRNSSGNLG